MVPVPDVSATAGHVLDEVSVVASKDVSNWFLKPSGGMGYVRCSE